MFWLVAALPRYFYLAVSLILITVALLLVSYGLFEVWVAMHAGRDFVTDELLNAIGVIVISVALVDVAKFLLEEEVMRRRSPRSSTVEMRRSLSKFVSIIAIAVCMESLVYIFKAGKMDMKLLIYPSLLLLSGTLMIIGLGVYLRVTQFALRTESDALFRDTKKRPDDERA
ncbi:MAG: hypothetical protein P8Y64_00560 [Gammaproteobacteria bacterium]|jgi:hypothetical protein